MGGGKKRLSRFAQHSCPNHPPPTWHPGGRDCQYYDDAESDAQASVGEGEETYNQTSLLSTLDPSDTLWNPDCLSMSNSCGSHTRPPVRSRPASSTVLLRRRRSGKPLPASSCSLPAICRIPLVPRRRGRFRLPLSSSGGGDDGRQRAGTVSRSRCVSWRSRWTVAAAMGDGGTMGGRTAVRPQQGREMGSVHLIFLILMREIFYIRQEFINRLGNQKR